MSLNQLHNILETDQVQVLFTDYYDTIVHRSVHPNYTQRLWAKLIIRELGLKISIDELYFTRQESVAYLKDKLKKLDVEIPYQLLKAEVQKRLLNENILNEKNKAIFLELFEKADLRAETNVQSLNTQIHDIIKKFKDTGRKVYLVSDFYGSKSLFKSMLEYHGILHLFDDIFSSAELQKSKQQGAIFNELITQLNIDPRYVMMIGDNKISDVANSQKNGLQAFLLPHQKQLRQNKLNNFGNDLRRFKKVVNSIYKDCHKKQSQPYSEYILFYHFFVERLYKDCRAKGVKSLFFLSREGLYLKKLFESYQDTLILDETNRIKTTYLRISRQASLQMSLKPIDEEGFEYLKKNYSALSIREFLNLFAFSDEVVEKIITNSADTEEKIESFFESQEFAHFKKNSTFRKYYEENRLSEKNAFSTYINSFDINIKEEGIHLVDIGWGGTMQESIFNFFNQEVKVTGYYVGLKEIYNITELTPRYGLIFSILPYKSYTDHILLANGQLYEQFLAAGHGSALGYSLNSENFTREFFEPSEKWLYDNYIKVHQEFTFNLHKDILVKLENVCYEDIMVQDQLTTIALRTGLLQSSKKLEFIDTLSKGFYQNIGENQVGISYKPPQIDNIPRKLLQFIINPEYYFRYLVKLKPAIHKKNKVLAFFTPMFLIYYYFRLNKYVRFRWLGKFLLLKYNAVK